MLVNSLGRLNPSAECRVFSKMPKTFYKLNRVDIEYRTQHKTAVSVGLASAKHNISDIEATLERVNNQITKSAVYRDLFKAATIPFCLSLSNNGTDLGTELENNWLPLLKTEFEKQSKGAFFRATLQGNIPLAENVIVLDLIN